MFTKTKEARISLGLDGDNQEIHRRPTYDKSCLAAELVKSLYRLSVSLQELIEPHAWSRRRQLRVLGTNFQTRQANTVVKLVNKPRLEHVPLSGLIPPAINVKEECASRRRSCSSVSSSSQESHADQGLNCLDSLWSYFSFTEGLVH